MFIATKIRAYGLGFSLLAAALAPSGCGNGGGTGVSGGDTGAGAGGAGAGATTATGTGAGPSGGGDLCNLTNVVNTWEGISDKPVNGTVIMTLAADGSYTLGAFTEPVPGVIAEEEETGTYKVDNNGLLTMTPKRSTCPTLSPIRIYGCTVVDGDLIAKDSMGNVGAWAPDPNPAPANPVTGCVVGQKWFPSGLMP